MKRNYMLDHHPEITITAFKQKPLQTQVRLVWFSIMIVVVYNWSMLYHTTETEEKCYVRELKQPKGFSEYVLVRNLAESSAEDINVSSNFNWIAFCMYS